MDDRLNTELLKLKMCNEICKKGEGYILQLAKYARVKHLKKIIELLITKGQ